jgi:hypothetical protein
VVGLQGRMRMTQGRDPTEDREITIRQQCGVEGKGERGGPVWHVLGQRVQIDSAR